MSEIVIKRIYEPFEEQDGYRVLIDRLWPRGISKEQAQLNEWAKEIAPSPSLRKWFGHKPERFIEFKNQYLIELYEDHVKVNKMKEIIQKSNFQKVTLLYGAKNSKYNHAVVLLNELLLQQSTNHE
ncbi:DUF488 domain-containing protein [Mesobacillus maritimus]|uniref:DUF488 domain-containing protein n=1 Tax=Mesobacillus maritimus TaxID=1643336 RepID=UPI00203CE6A6|nr:DUF488 domain-containing protein [Mesobacillus maritimus]MCM3668339.1 DUF488 domain-containing protein [Mesobacillus maritimus]